MILDASVGVKWIFQEALSEKAEALLKLAEEQKVEIVVPGLFYEELANACWLRVRKNLPLYGTTDDALDRIADLPLLKTYPNRELTTVAYENALQFNISAYDAHYVSLAEVYVAPLITADEKLLAACRGKFDFIESLAEIKLPA